MDEPANARSRRTREALLDAARAILATDGFDALTMAGVAERAGVTRRAVYLHFDNLAALLACLFDHIATTERLEASMAPIWDAPDAEQGLTRWVHHLADYHPRVMAVDRALQQVERSDPAAAAHRARVNGAQRAVCERLGSWLHEEERLGPGWDPETAADMLFGLISTDLIDRLTRTCGWGTAQLADGLSRLVRGGLVEPE